jgi:hypothetical protein
MRIFAKKAFGFRAPDGTLVSTTPGQFQDVPDWVGEDDLFKLAAAEGSIEVVQMKPSVAVPDKKEEKQEKKEK